VVGNQKLGKGSFLGGMGGLRRMGGLGCEPHRHLWDKWDEWDRWEQKKLLLVKQL